MKKLLLCLSVLITLTVSAQHVPKGLTAANGEFIGFYQYTPLDYSTNVNTKYPVIIFLHGIGETGNGTTELSKVIGLGVPGAIEAGSKMTFTWNGKTETFLVLSPQLNGKWGGWQNFYIEEMINYAKKNLRIDENRIFLTGLSLGGGGVWGYPGASLDNAKKLAGIGVSCGVCPWNANFSNYTNANLPIWAFHAQDDGTVGVGCTTGTIASINNLNPAVKPYMTIWPDGGHWIWGRVFDVGYNSQNPNIYEWFLGQNKSLPVNKRPVANAGSDIATTPSSATITLNGSKSTDADGKLVRYIWTKLSGPNAGTIATPVSTNGSSIVTGLTVAGTYQYELKVVDERCDWTMDTVNVVVSATPPANNKPPVPNAGVDITVMQPVTQVTLKGSATDADGSIASYSWIKVSGPANAQIVSPNDATTQVTGLLVGTYVFKLFVADDKNGTAADDITVTVLASDGRAQTGVDPGPNVTITLPTNSITLDGTASYDPFGGKINGWRWLKLSGPAGGTVTNTGVSVTTATGLTEGVYVFQLTTWNSQWAPQSANKIVTVLPGGSTPPPANTNIAKAGADQAITLPTNSVTLNGSGTVDPTGALKSIAWTKIAGPTAGTITTPAALTTTVTALTEGTYQFRLTVANSQGVYSSDTVAIVVNPAVTTPPPTKPANRIADAGSDQTIQLPTSSVTLNGSGSIDPLGALQAVAWTKISGPAAGTITTSSALTTTATGLTAGTYQFRLLVYSKQWVPSSDTVQIVVKPGSTDNSNGGGNGGEPVPGDGTGPSGNGTITNAGPDRAIQLPTNSVILDGTASNDPSGALKSWFWNKISGPSGETITNASTSKPTITNLVAGVYKFRLTTWSSQWVPYSDTMQLTVLASGTATMATARTVTTVAADEDVKSAAKEGLLIYPNPAQSQINIQTSSNINGASSLNVYDMTGKLALKVVFQKAQSLHQQVLNISSLTPGLYQVEVVIDNGTRLKSKFVKQ
ncbi:T9SS type A sorting domain-containing protein [Paraflavitalea sp. CAU 1676]|uniref:PKD domain-containing protein n=1 Tax=Paraflavitalea sp. CAU 1676 TaxID=3032598 RepID=UPI0023DC3E2A|nr:T9SS type A sorting domain-containing protein [Paraflavitalea sp. CAU 1676]MDF2187500.1 T9SS type A sorting domain-containing protein [Paraflavitalea sp. CAU 1676]